MRVVVVGGGIGGLAAGLALRRVGHEVQLLERADELREVGAGLSLWSNAVLALRRLGVEGPVVDGAAPLESFATLDVRGRVLAESALGPLVARAGAPSVCAHRADLQRALADALGRERVRTGAVCVGVEARDDGATVLLAGGEPTSARSIEADVVVGADGIRSAVRAALFGPSEPRYAGYTAWRGVARGFDHPELPRGRGLFCMGRGVQLGLMACGQGRTYWFITANAPQGGSDREAKAAALAAVADWPEVARAAVAATEPGAVFRNDIIDRPPTRDWGRGRVTLLGDAVHATTPNLGQGACQALEDAVVLGHALKGSGDPTAGLRAYEAARRDRTAFVQTTSWRLGRLLQAESRLVCWLRDVSTASFLGKRQGDETLERLLVTELPELG